MPAVGGTAALTGRPLTVADYGRLDEDELVRWELQEGNLVLTPSPTVGHMDAAGELFVQVRAQLPDWLHAVLDVDVDLQLTSSDQPGSVRHPDLVVVQHSEFERARRERSLLRAEGAALVVEILSPSSRRTDRMIKRAEYADAGIPHYWMIDIDSPVTLVACHLAGELGYQDAGAVTGSFSATEPFPVRLDLDAMA